MGIAISGNSWVQCNLRSGASQKPRLRIVNGSNIHVVQHVSAWTDSTTPINVLLKADEEVVQRWRVAQACPLNLSFGPGLAIECDALELEMDAPGEGNEGCVNMIGKTEVA